MNAPDAAARPSDPGLQPERTALAWRRTALALVAGSLLGLRVLPTLLGTAGLVVAAAGVIAALAVLATAHSRYRRVHRILTSASAVPVTTALPGGALPALVAALTACAGLAALALALAR
ncbi:DUF202 domain-containing protein [Clavibacter michiganensis]|uniref:DUF202 domain-containing protein n=1 Tax=Clavibacter michiganensis TaxID=28447 RepID=UPI000CE7A943|nr:DUF202 domain-containing protein [Clavibacter michiganensis]MDO4044021.1 DUF202 domain-containing protein [Clavibacter michiganensis]MDO4052391.1 DUF202 domain-containing protein [Clavibacter michiganensis]MDO4056190.1 DUF202 domain-containing protein [Clavibacter michiganensis]MDO4068598.1 DUF202 domain-containing protein [Clavibacter michiganensis]MDO4073711.1 DUF202 domain-containing protein [Clavibacter michiganensis]